MYYKICYTNCIFRPLFRRSFLLPGKTKAVEYVTRCRTGHRLAPCLGNPPPERLLGSTRNRDGSARVEHPRLHSHSQSRTDYCESGRRAQVSAVHESHVEKTPAEDFPKPPGPTGRRAPPLLDSNRVKPPAFSVLLLLLLVNALVLLCSVSCCYSQSRVGLRPNS